MNETDKILAYREQMRKIGYDPLRFGRQTEAEKVAQRRSSCDSGSSYDHRWDDHPSWYTDDKSKQREMVRKSKQKRRDNWD